MEGKDPYVTKDSGARAEYKSGMVRDTEEGKARFDLLFPLNVPYAEQMITRFADLMTRGATKYSERNWEKARGPEELSRYRSSALRHLVQWVAGEHDEDHAAAVMFNLLAGETVQYREQAEFDLLPDFTSTRDLERRDADLDDLFGPLRDPGVVARWDTAQIDYDEQSQHNPEDLFGCCSFDCNYCYEGDMCDPRCSVPSVHDAPPSKEVSDLPVGEASSYPPISISGSTPFTVNVEPAGFNMGTAWDEGEEMC